MDESGVGDDIQGVEVLGTEMPPSSETAAASEAGDASPVVVSGVDGAVDVGDLQADGISSLDLESLPLSPLQQVMEIVQTGGPVVVILLCLSVFALTIIVFKLLQFTFAGVWGNRSVGRAVIFCREGKLHEALALVQGARDPISRSMALAIRGRLRRDVDEASVREEVARFANTEIESLRSHIGFLELVGSLAPLLGLLGTVLGMINAFKALEVAGRNVDPAVLSGGIWVALLTTAVGLIVAIPVVAISNWLSHIVDLTAHRLEDAVTRVFTPDLSQRIEVQSDDNRAIRA